MRALPWIIAGSAAALAAYYWRRDSETSKTRADGGSGSGTHPEPLPGRWVWPVGIWHDRKPEISDGFATRRQLASGQIVAHGGVDLMYRRQPGDPWRAGTPNGSRGYIMPDHRAALAASDGVVSFAASTPRGWTVIIDHAPRKLATYYTHLSQLLVVPKQPVRAGQPIGIIGGDPLDAAHLMHLHLEIWHGGANGRFDPEPLMRSWEYLPDPGDMPATLVARNAPGRVPPSVACRSRSTRSADRAAFSRRGAEHVDKR